MASIGSFLPKPKHTAESDSTATSNNDLGITILSKLGSEERQLVSKTYNIPPYGQRGPKNKWRPKSVEDFGDGGAYPEIPVIQHPRDMGRPKTPGGGPVRRQNKTLALTVTSDGQTDYSSIAKQGHNKSRIVQSSFTDLIPLRQRAKKGELTLDRPSDDTVQETANRTQAALQKIVESKVASSKPKSAVATGADGKSNATYIRYTPSNMMGESSQVQHRQRIIKLVDVQEDPLAPPKFKHTKVPARPPSPPPPVLRSPPRKLTAQDQKDWYIPPSVSNWKNPKGYTIAIDKRMASDGRNLQTATINDNFAKLAESLAVADNKMRSEVSQRNAMRKKLKEKEEEERNERMRQLAQNAKEEREQLLQRTRRPQKVNEDQDYRTNKKSYKNESESEGEGEEEDDGEEEEERRRSPSPRRSSVEERGRYRRGSSSSRRPRSRSASSDDSNDSRSRSRSRTPESRSPKRYSDRDHGRYEKRGERRRREGGRGDRRDSSGSDEDEDERPHNSRDYRRDQGNRRRERSRTRSESPYSSDESPERRRRRRDRYQDSRRGRRSSYSDNDDDGSESEDNRSDEDRRRGDDRRDRRHETRERTEERRRHQLRQERLEEEKRKMRMSRMGTERRVKSMMKDQDRDISERVALGVARPSQVSTGESLFDSRLMGSVSVSREFNEDQVYDSSLFKANEAMESIYRLRGNKGAKGLGSGRDDEDDDSEMGRISGERRFESLGEAKHGFKGADVAEERAGPVEFEKDESDPFGVGKMVKQVEAEKRMKLDD